VREFLYGLFGYETAQQAMEIRSSVEKLFLLATFGDMLGLPIMPPYYALRLLPFVCGNLSSWKRALLRERQLGDPCGHHLHGI